jgi:hypothetical protein
MLAAATSADNSVSGRITGEQITLTVSPAATDYQWSLAIPSAASPARSALSAETGSSVKFTPDVAGVWTVTATVDSSVVYVLRIGVTSTAISQLAEAIRLTPKTNASVPTPAVGVCLFYSSDEGALCIKDAAGAVFTVDVTAT